MKCELLTDREKKIEKRKKEKKNSDCGLVLWILYSNHYQQPIRLYTQKIWADTNYSKNLSASGFYVKKQETYRSRERKENIFPNWLNFFSFVCRIENCEKQSET